MHELVDNLKLLGICFSLLTKVINSFFGLYLYFAVEFLAYLVLIIYFGVKVKKKLVWMGSPFWSLMCSMGVVPLASAYSTDLKPYKKQIWWSFYILEFFFYSIPVTIDLAVNPNLVLFALNLSLLLKNYGVLIFNLYYQHSPEVFSEKALKIKPISKLNKTDTIKFFSLLLSVLDEITDIIYFATTDFSNGLKYYCLFFILLNPTVFALLTASFGTKVCFKSPKKHKGIALILGAPLIAALFETKLIGLGQVFDHNLSSYKNHIWYAVMISENFGESIPQIIIQGINNTEQDNWGNWISVLSYVLSIASVVKDIIYIVYCTIRKISLAPSYCTQTEWKSFWDIIKILKEKTLKLDQVELESYLIGDQEAIAIAGVLELTQVTKLDLAHKSIKQEGCKAIAEVIPKTRLTYLNLKANKVGEQVGCLLASSLPDSQIRELCLSQCSVGNSFAQRIGSILPECQLESLDLSYNNISKTGAKFIVAGLTKLSSLDLSGNFLCDSGAEALGKVLENSGLKVLKLNSCGIRIKGLLSISNGLLESELQILELGNNFVDFEEEKAILLLLNSSHLSFDTLEKNCLENCLSDSLLETKSSNLSIQLNLSGKFLGYQAALGWGNLLPKVKIVSLDLSQNAIEEEGAFVLASNLANCFLRDLKLRENNIGTRGWTALAQSLKVSSLKSLDVSNNSIERQAITELLKCIPESSVTELNLSSNSIKKVLGTRIAGALGNLKSLNLSENVLGNTGAQQIAKALPNSKLKTLNLSGNRLGNEAMEALSRNLSMLTELDVSKNQITQAGAIDLLKALPFSEVVSLNLSQNLLGDSISGEIQGSKLTKINLSRTGIGDNSAVTLLKANPLLESVNMNENRITQRIFEEVDFTEFKKIKLEHNKIRTLDTSLFLESGLEHLNLGQNPIDPELRSFILEAKLGLKVLNLDQSSGQLLNSLDFSSINSNIESISLRSNFLNDQLVKHLNSLNLKVLDLKDNNIGPKGAFWIAQTLRRTPIRSLNLNQNQISNDGAYSLANALAFSHLEELKLKANQIYLQGCVKLLTALTKSQLTHLDLSQNSLGSEVGKTLIKVLPKSYLRSLNLSWTSIDLEGAKGIAEALPDSPLQSLYLKGNYLCDRGTKVIAEAIPLSCLTLLNLANNEITTEGAVSLVSNSGKLTWLGLKSNKIKLTPKIASEVLNSNLKSLCLHGNSIKNKGVSLIAKILPDSKLTELDLQANKIKDQGAIALALALPKSKLRSLNLADNQIGNSGSRALCSSLDASLLTSLSFQNNQLTKETACRILEVLPYTTLNPASMV